MTCLIKGCNFVLKNIPHEVFAYQKDSDTEFRFQTNHPNIFPYLLVNIGSGVSIVKVETGDKFEWIGGSSIGGGTFWGLGALLTKTKKFDELLQLASKGQHTNVDMLVKDVYGGAYQTLGLSGNLIASSFGKSATADKDPNEYSWGENYAGSSGLMSPSPDLCPMQRARSGTFDMFEMDRLERPLVNLPLLKDPSTYIPDTVDLTDDAMARKYWLTCFEEALDGVVKRAMASQPDSIDAAERAEKFRQKYWNKLQTLRQQPFAYGTLTVRSLLDTREHCLNEFSFPDPYSKVKQKENGIALKCFPSVIESLDSLGWEERQFALVKGLLAGNVFDWGAKAVSEVLESEPQFGFEEAKEKLQERPWLEDSYSEWIQRLKEGPPHKCALIFADNSGIDIILGVFPFVRELLSRGSEVILACNSGPALNDVTYSESLIVTERIAAMDPIIQSALMEERLLLVQTGSSSPCLDLSRLDKGLALLVRERKTDLVIIEGMGRAIHTNYYAALQCESLKLAVIKNSWLADRLGGKIFSVIFKYEVPLK
ncbi:4'-phosphopantetheine phosphatase isoform X2 [Chelonoidis abingdonii]|uniref:4'-phosphopantetheine phosphatase isoform X2 n=1 Tax=Chelonoidis abingdonii TaxID=106734 RepID=UPI003F4990D3